MVARRCIIALALPVLGLAATGPAAHAADCAPTAQATLTLDADSVTTVAYGRGSRPTRTLLLRFRAEGCEIPADAPAPSFEVLPKQGAKEIPADVVTVMRTGMAREEFSIRLRVDARKFDPGTYGGFVEVSSPYLATTRTPITISRSEGNWLFPLGIGLIGGVAGLLWFMLLNRAKGATDFALRHYWYVIGAAAFAGMFAVGSTYVDQEVWTLGENGFAAAVSAFTGATTGAMATALAVLWRDPKRDPVAA